MTPRLENIIATAITSVRPGQTSPPLTLVRLDGRSDQVTSGSFASDAENSDAFRDDQSTFLATFTSAVTSDRAAVAEADDIAALSTSARAARDPNTRTGTVVLIDSGLSTVTPLDFSAPGVLDADTDEMVTSLVQHHAIPDLSGLVVVLIGIGDVAFPSTQDRLDPPRQKHLVDLYTKIAQKGGAACVEPVASPRSGPATASVPSVRPVPVPRTATISTTNPAPTVLPDDPVTGFVAEKPKLLDPNGAQTVLRPLADWLAADPRHTVLLSGTTARVGDLPGQQKLGRERAETIKQVLVQLGASPAQVSTDGLGSEFPGYTPDHDASGALLPGPAHDNRSVRVVPSANS